MLPNAFWHFTNWQCHISTAYVCVVSLDDACLIPMPAYSIRKYRRPVDEPPTCKYVAPVLVGLPVLLVIVSPTELSSWDVNTAIRYGPVAHVTEDAAIVAEA